MVGICWATAALAGTAQAETKAPPEGLSIRTGWEIGGLLSDYRYEEPDFMWLKGKRIGITGAYTAANPNRAYARLEMRASYGDLDYQGSGTLSGVPDYLFELRALAGRDYALGSSMAWSPYVGVGIRLLYNDLRGTTSTGQLGYRRESKYFYIPLGVTLRMPLGAEWVLAPQLEYNGFVRGSQRSYLSDTGLPLSDVTNQQRQGRGYRVQVMFESRRWSIGPWLDYWNVKDSDVQQIAPGVGGMEPANWTREAGVEVRYRF
jgi:hypothetical protein